MCGAFQQTRAVYCLLLVGGVLLDAAVLIEKPQPFSVVRTQSVEVEVAVDESALLRGAMAYLELDGRYISEVPVPHISFILSDEQGMSEGIHNVTVVIQRPSSSDDPAAPSDSSSPLVICLGDR